MAVATLQVRPLSATPGGGSVRPADEIEANLAGDTLEEVTAAAERGIQRIRATPHLAYSFLRHCGLSLW
jgi:hypothetical protein